MLIYDMEGAEFSTNFWTAVFQKTHSHKFWEIVFICKGSLINSLNDKEVEMKKYDIALIHPNDIHRLIPKPNVDAHYYNICFSEAYFKAFCDHIHEDLFEELTKRDDLYATLSAHRYIKILNFINNACSTTNKKEVKKYHNIVLSHILPEFINTESQPEQSAVAQAIAIMMNPSKMCLSIKEIANQIGYTPEHLTRLFKQEIGDTPSNYYLNLKMQHAKILLNQTDCSVQFIASTIGMSSLRHFYRVFKEYYHISPISMRKK